MSKLRLARGTSALVPAPPRAAPTYDDDEGEVDGPAEVTGYSDLDGDIHGDVPGASDGHSARMCLVKLGCWIDVHAPLAVSFLPDARKITLTLDVCSRRFTELPWELRFGRFRVRRYS